MATSVKGRRSNGKAPSGGQKKKQPQRGMGVAQLERLRMGPTLGPPLLPKLGVVAAPTMPSELRSALMLHLSSGHGGPSSAVGSDQTPAVDPCCRNGAPDCGLQFHVGCNGSFRELSSMPNTHCSVDDCCVFIKKKRSINGDDLGISNGGKRGEFVEPSQINGHDFLGLSLGDNSSVNGTGQDLPQGLLDHQRRIQRPPMVDYSKFFHVDHGDGGSDAKKAVRTKLAKPDHQRSLTEYEFFPAPESGMEASMESMPSGKAPPTTAKNMTTTRNWIVEGPDAVDLSLKL